MIGKISHKKKLQVEVDVKNGTSAGGLTPAEKQQIEKIAVIEKQIIDVKANFKGIFYKAV